MTSSSQAAQTPQSADLPSVDLQTFRLMMASFPSGVTVVTTTDEKDEPRGLTCSAFCSVSVDPPLLLSSVASRSGTLAALLERGRFAVNILDSQGQAVSQLFASGAADKFDRVRWEPGATSGMPLLRGSLARIECEVHQTTVAGDHTLVIGRVIGGSFDQDKLPVTYWRGDYARLLRFAEMRQPVAAA